MQQYIDSVTHSNGTPVAGASIRVLTAAGAVATIYSDNGVTVATNPIKAGSNGQFSFYAADGNYSLVISAPGHVTRTVTGIVLSDMSNIGYGNLPDAGTLTGIELVAVGRTGVFQTTLTKIAQWVIQTYQGFTQSGAGAVARTVQDKLREQVSVVDFGAVPGLGVSDSQAAQNVTAFQAALDYVSSIGGGIVSAIDQYYVLSARIYLPDGVTLIGAGVDEWDPIYSSRPKQWAGTNLIFKGTGVRDLVFNGVTSMKYAGGWRADPDTPATTYKLTSFYNADASSTTPATSRLLSAAVMNKTNARYCGVKNLRIVPWIGTDGVSEYSSTSSVSLGAAYDIGLLLLNSEYARIENVQVVGYWREFGHLEIATAITESHSERNSRVRCKFQGRVGLGIRGMDRWAVSSTTTSSVAITWSEESYLGSAGTFTGSNGTVYAYTGASLSGTTLTLSGVTPAPTGISNIYHSGSGFGNSTVDDSMAYGLHHVSGQLAATFGLADSKPLEVSGYPLRGVKFHNFKMHTNEKIMGHIHDAYDATFIDCQVEGGTFFIASPVNTEATYATAACGETRNIVMLGDVGTDTMDARLFLPRTGFVQGLMLAPRATLTGDSVLTALRAGKDLVALTKSGQSFYVRNSSGTNVFRVTDTGNMTLQGNVNFQSSNAYSIGSTSAYAQKVCSTDFYINSATTTTAPSAGGAGALPATPLGYMTFYVAGVARKVAYY